MLCSNIRMLFFSKLPRLILETNYVKSCSRNLQISAITKSKFGAKHKPLLTPKDCHERFDASVRMLKLIEKDPKMLSNIIFSDEGYITLKKNLYGTAKFPYLIIWCGLTSKRIIGPYFFDSPVTGSTYLNMIDTFLMKELSDSRQFNTKETWFQQDAHPAHLTKPVMNALKERFNGQLLSLKSRNIWPRKSPDLNPLDFFVWPKLKKLKIRRKRCDVSHLKEIITKEINSIPETETEAAVQEFYYRLQACKTYKGSLQL